MTLDEEMRWIVVQDRYIGSYSGAGFTAWRGVVPDAVVADDNTCLNFWQVDPRREACGKGDTPQAALDDLFEKVGQPNWELKP